MTIHFEWQKNEIIDLLASCERDGLFPFIIKYIRKDDKILESGCGLARWVKNLDNKGYDCKGLEYSFDTVKTVHEIWPELDLFVGDVLQHPFKNNSFDAVISLGVVEHFEEGPDKALSDIFRILKPGGTGIITVPCFNMIRKLKHPFTRQKLIFYVKKRGEPKKFFEYRFSPDYFMEFVKTNGFEVLEEKPFAHIDGFYHELDPLHLIVKFSKWKFDPEDFWLNRLLSKIPYVHCHMLIIVVRKPDISDTKFFLKPAEVT
jgi:SAM-dependent methyltransferase